LEIFQQDVGIVACNKNSTNVHLVLSGNLLEHKDVGNVFRLLRLTWIFLEIGKKSY